ncbi:non-ribosomal peptide synthetase [Micromonospora tarensis]|uniref:Amino acid adenylation domain-containing protein n=1 Tax=Micromonospora tarensis TaxID=2806100 RepID=A0ABS1YA50_9ACTN|nr:non-ribosomal peptide synthetase [Micromonospora tarensis]MBM0274286.1 amino acid adenylation domain-containing protein [Micromonospora tarensis]
MPHPSQPPALPITESQKGLLVIDSWLPRREIYNQIIQLDVAPALPFEHIRNALAEVVAVQPALRQIFQLRPELGARLADPPSPADLPIERVVVETAEYERATGALVERLARQPIELTVGPAYRFGHLSTRDGTGARILLCLHHVVCDGLSLGPLVRDLEAALAGDRPRTAPEALRTEREQALLRELTAQQRASAPDRVLPLVKTWAERLRAVPPLVLSPRPHRPTEPGYRGERIAWTLDDRETTAFEETCRALAVSPFVLLTGVFGAVVARHGGVPTVLIGSPFSARRTVGAFDLCGYFVNTLPITVDVTWQSTVAEFLGTSVRAAVDFCRSSAHVTFNQVVAEVQPDRPGSRNPLFGCMLAMQDTHEQATGGAVTAVREPANGWAKFDLWLGATRVDGRTWLLELEYDTALLAPTVAEGILHSLRTALNRAAEDRTRPLADLFVDFPPPAAPPPAHVRPAEHRTLQEWVMATARRQPGAVALAEEGKQLTYQELVAAAGRVAAGLRRSGVTAGDVVAVATDGLCDTIVAVLGILRCGAAFVSLDPALPEERLATMARIARCRIVVGKGIDVPGVRTVDPTEFVADGPQTIPTDAEAHPAYVMFTSGSTGVPKGVLMGQRPLINLATWQLDALRQDENTRFFQYAPMSFDVCYQEILPTLASGGTVVSREPADRRDFPALVRRVADTRVTHLFLPAAGLRPFALSALGLRASLPHLRYVCVSGQQLVLDDDIRRFFTGLTDCALVNLYGPTETNAVTVHHLTGDARRWPSHVPIGRPMPGVVAYVVDQTGHLAPPGVPGELYLGGDCLAEGYLNDPERTAAAFLPDRFAGTADARMYRTGDLVARDEDGVLVYLGRRDTQVKVRGHRVELGEIETVANGVADVREAVAVARPAGSDVELVLFVHPEDGRRVDHAAVRAQLAAALPGYMMPAWIFDLSYVPTSGTGKTDRAALAARADGLVAQATADRPDRVPTYADETQRELAALWADILEVDTIPADVSLLDCGAHSLNAFVAFAEIQHRFGVTVDVATFFRNPTVAALADLVRARGATART